jgi:hypothetical protein
MNIPEGYLEQFKQRQSGANNERASVIDIMYLIYASERPLRDKENWKRYFAWTKENRVPRSPEMRARFKKETLRKRGGYIDEKSKKDFAIFLAPFNGDEGLATLYYCSSVMRDMHQMGKNASAWLFSSVAQK